MEEHKITYKTKDGTLKEQKFDDFNEFADAIESVAGDFYKTGMMPPMEIETNYGTKRTESVSGNGRTAEFLGETDSAGRGETESI